MRVRMVLGVLVTSMVVVGVGCGKSPYATVTPTTACLPAMPTASPTSVVAGGTVTVASRGFTDCGSYAEPRTYSMWLGTVGRQAPADLGHATAAPDGTFSVTVTIPPGTSPGESYIGIQGSDFDKPCKDTNSCAGYTTPALQVLAPAAS